MKPKQRKKIIPYTKKHLHNVFAAIQVTLLTVQLYTLQYALIETKCKLYRINICHISRYYHTTPTLESDQNQRHYTNLTTLVFFLFPLPCNFLLWNLTAFFSYFWYMNNSYVYNTNNLFDCENELLRFHVIFQTDFHI